MRTFIFIPPVRKAAGGVTVLRQLGRYLHEAGRDVHLVLREDAGWVPAGLDNTCPEMRWDELDLQTGDLWLVPEGWVNALTPGLQAGARCVNYVQNWAYLFSALPEGVTWDRLPVEFLSVSQTVGWYVEQATRRPAPVLRPGIDLSRFRPPKAKPDGPVNIAWMPRKNKALARQIHDLYASRNPQADVRWTAIEGLDADGVARALADAHVFLATGFPEGCPLPPLEAMASGCMCVGFSGFGGWDYMRQACPLVNFQPWWPLREVDWGGNGLWSADADVMDAMVNLEWAVKWCAEGDPLLGPCLEAAQQTARAYGEDAQRKRVLEIWDAYERGGVPD